MSPAAACFVGRLLDSAIKKSFLVPAILLQRSGGVRGEIVTAFVVKGVPFDDWLEEEV
jgi:hypothetical protein